MTETLDGVATATSTKQERQPKRTAEQEAERAAIRALVRAAKGRGEDLTGPDGLLRGITKQVLETALDEEMNDHLGYDKHDPDGYNSGNSRNGTRTKTVLTDNAGPISVEVPRDRNGTSTPVIVPKRSRRLGDVDTIVLSLGRRSGDRFLAWRGAHMSEEVSRGTPDDRFVGKGTVKFWKREKGWGAVYVPDFANEGDVFVYCSALWGAGLRELQQGQEVTISFYRQKQDSFNLVAATVQPA